MVIALAGNQNCGKTTLFNRLTGSRQHVGNWPGVTVEQKRGMLLSRWQTQELQPVEMIDLPGVYSLAPFSQEEEITRQFLLHGNFDVTANIVDATHLERNLYLTLQLLTLGKPLVLALNLMDQARANGLRIDTSQLSRKLGVPVVPICARTGEGIPALMAAARKACTQAAPAQSIHCSGPAAEALRQVTDLLRGNPALQQRLHAAGFLQDPAAASAALLETGPEKLESLFPLEKAADLAPVLQVLRRLETLTGLPAPAALAAGRYRWLEQLLSECCTQPATNHPWQLLDRWLLCSRWAVPALVTVLAMVFCIAFGKPGQQLTDAFTQLLQNATGQIGFLLDKWQVAPGLQSLLVEGLLPGLCSVLSFLPPLMLLMFLLNLLEESGYLARVAFLMDRPLRVMGLGGRSLIPFLMGFGCTVPAVLSARSLKSRRERILTVLLTSLMSCGAKLPVYLLLARAFFPMAQLPVVAGLYLLGILLAVAAALVLKHTMPPTTPEPFLLELPAYRLPSLRNALRDLWHKSSEFLSRTFSVILLATLAVWVLSRFRFSLQPAGQLSDSMLGVVAGWLSPWLAPCGFGHAAAAAALLTGLLAKENIVSTLMVLTGLPTAGMETTAALRSVFPSPLSAFSFLVFVLCYPPCAAATACIRRETGSLRLTLAAYVGQLLLAWVASMLMYQVGSLLG